MCCNGHPNQCCTACIGCRGSKSHVRSSKHQCTSCTQSPAFALQHDAISYIPLLHNAAGSADGVFHSPSGFKCWTHRTHGQPCPSCTNNTPHQPLYSTQGHISHVSCQSRLHFL